MGLIKAGEVKGNIPSSEVFAVHYPGYSSVSRAIQTLGGSDAISNARSERNKLELYFRPEDPYSHPLSAQLRPSNYLLLKISKKMWRKAAQPQLTADIVHRITESYHFTGMADYQHVVAVHAEATKKKKRSWSEIEQPSFEKIGFIDLDHQDLMILLPPRFSPKDMPENLVLRPSSLQAKEKQDEIAEHNSMKLNVKFAPTIDFSVDEVPSEIDCRISDEGTAMWSCQMIVSELFNERPIWHKDSIIERLVDRGLKFNHIMIKRVLLSFAYYFSGGPFLRLWIKKGYDPRKDSDSRMYQRIDFRVPHSLRSYCDANSAKGLKQNWKDVCKFRAFPSKCHSSFQLCELDDQYIQEEIRKPSLMRTCSYATGWFSQYVHDSLKVQVMVRFLSLFPEGRAKKLLKAANHELEKLRRSSLRNDASKPDLVHEPLNPTICDQEQDPLNPTISEEVEDDIEFQLFDNDVDEEEDDENDDNILEGYEYLNEALDMAEELPMESQTYSKNDSRSYLQHLFGGFPPAEAKSQEVGSSEEEYQIFDDTSDNDSDE